MGLVRYTAVAVAGALLVSFEANALPFISLDPRVNAMGGAGVASATGVTAGFVNPALLLGVSNQGDSTVLVPVVMAARYSDPKNLQDEIEHYQGENLEAIFEAKLTAYKGDSSTPTVRSNLATATQNLLGQLKRFSQRALEGDLGAGFAVSMPDERPGMALLVDRRAVGGGKLVNVAADFSTFSKLIDGLNKNLAPDDAAFNIIVSGPSRNLQARLLARGALITEVGLALARETTVGGQKVAVGIAPKYLDVTTFDYARGLDSASFKASEGQRRYASVNLDLGMTTEFASGWRGGVAIRNLIPHEFQTVQDNSVRLQPQARAGVAYSGEWVRGALDVDLNEGAAVGFEANTQYLGLGAEMDLSKTMQLRVGYRYNMSDTNSNVMTAGVGVELFGTVVDVATTINEDELGLSARVGFHF